MAAVRKYAKIKKHSPRMRAGPIDHIDVPHAEVVTGGKIQRIVIYYNCVGSIEIPEDVNIPSPQISMKTRQGVEVIYNPGPPVAK